MILDSPTQIAKSTWQFSSKIDKLLISNSYLIENGIESILIDPSPINNIEELCENISKVTDLKNIKYIILHHQGSNICTGVPYLENIINRDDLEIIGHTRQESAIRYYGVKSRQYIIDKRSLSLGDLKFITTPYAHSAGSFVTFHKSTKTLFSGTLFSNYEEYKEPFTTANDIENIKQYHREHIPMRDILNYTLNKLEVINIELIAPQFGAKIDNKMIKRVSNELRKIECGMYIDPDYINSLSLAIEKLWQSEALLKKQKYELDITVDKKTKDLQITNSKLISALEAKSKFIASVSHELRTPLNPIINFSEYLIDELSTGVVPSNSEYKRILKKIYKHAKKLNKMIDTLLDQK